jgi:hypothetical protein
LRPTGQNIEGAGFRHGIRALNSVQPLVLAALVDQELGGVVDVNAILGLNVALTVSAMGDRLGERMWDTRVQNQVRGVASGWVCGRREMTMMHRILESSRKSIAIGRTALFASPAAADSLSGVYQGFLAFDFKGKEVREWMMISFNPGGTVVMGAEEGQDEPVDPETGVVTKNDFESTNLGLWRSVDANTLEFGSQQYRAGSAFCGPVNKHGEGLLPTCSFILTARLTVGAEVRGESCDLGGLNGGLAVQSVDGTLTEANPLNLGLKIDYCLQKMSVDHFLELAPVE